MRSSGSSEEQMFAFWRGVGGGVWLGCQRGVAGGLDSAGSWCALVEIWVPCPSFFFIRPLYEKGERANNLGNESVLRKGKLPL